MADTKCKDQLALDLGDTAATLTVRDLIVRGQIDSPSPITRKPKPQPTFERALVDGADCAFRRRVGNKSELLVLLATQAQAYVMDERTGRRRALTAARLASFCDGAEGDALTPPWSADALWRYDSAARRELVELFGTEGFSQLARRDMVRVSCWELSRAHGAAYRVRGSWESVWLMWRLVEPAVGHDVARDALSSAMGVLCAGLAAEGYVAYELFRDCRHVGDLDSYLGRDRMRGLVADVLGMGGRVPSGTMGDVVSATRHLVGRLGQLGVAADGARLCRHVLAMLSERPRRYRSRASNIVAWAECLDAQRRVRGEVFEAWPADPRGLCLQLEWEEAERGRRGADERIAERARALSDKAHSDGSFLIRPAGGVSELVEEGERQHNCVGTYCEAVASGETDVWLMRDARRPERPLVTVEVRDGRVRQAFRACNEPCTPEQFAWLRKWCEGVGYRIQPDPRFVPQAA